MALKRNDSLKKQKNAWRCPPPSLPDVLMREFRSETDAAAAAAAAEAFSPIPIFSGVAQLFFRADLEFHLTILRTSFRGLKSKLSHFESPRRRRRRRRRRSRLLIDFQTHRQELKKQHDLCDQFILLKTLRL